MIPTVSIAICAWRSRYVERAIVSVLDQEFPSVEVVVCDDAGDSEQVVDRIGDERVRYHRNDHRLGVAGNAAAALNLSRGRYVGVLGDDDRLLPGYLEATTRVLEQDSEIGLVFTNYFCEEEGRLFRRGTALREGRFDDFLASYMEAQRVPMSATLMRREVWADGQERMPMPETVAPDLFIYSRAAMHGWPFYFLDRPLMAYRLHPGMTSRSDDFRDMPIETWERFRFDDPFCERQRRRLLAEAYVARGAARTRRGFSRQARADFGHAKDVDAEALARHRRVYFVLASVPMAGALAERARRAFRRLRPGAEFTPIDRANPIPEPDPNL